MMLDKMKIMVVDDNTVNLATIEQELNEKYEVIPMLTGRRAIKYLYREKVDLILLDVQMPIMDGIETLKEIRNHENGVTVPVIFLTAKKDAATVIAGSQLGIMDYITKPFDPEDLKNRIEQVFKRLGVLPMEDEELYSRIDEIREDIIKENIKPAILKTDEVLRFQIDEEVSGRMRNVKQKLESQNYEAAENMVERVLEMMERKLMELNQTVYIPIMPTEIAARLLYVKDDLENFRIHDAVDKLKTLQDYDLPITIRRKLKKAQSKLNDYDDTEAEVMIDEILKAIEHDSGHGSDGGNDKETGGYRSLRLR